MIARRRIVIAALLISCSWSVEAQTLNDARLRVELVASGLSVPTSMAFVGDDDILVLQKNDGRVRRILGGALLADDVLDVAVHTLSERGLLGIATDPDFIHNAYVYLFFTESSTGGDTSSGTATPLGNRVYRYTWDGSALVQPRLVLDLPVTPGANHDGGVIGFGPEDALYAVIGDLNRDGKLQNFPAGPDPDDSGVILRVHASGKPRTDNPFFEPELYYVPMARYYAYGVRNSFGMAFDPVSGQLWNSENGPNTYDEVNLVVPGLNSGWERIMGPEARDPEDPGDLWNAPGSVYRDPEFSWLDTVAPTAVAFVASRVLGCELEHDLLVGDFNCGQLYRFVPTPTRDGLVFSSAELQDKVADNNGNQCGGEMAEVVFGTGWGAVTDIENGPDGRLYVVSVALGAVYRIEPAPGTFPDADTDGVDDGCDCAATDATAYAAPSEVPLLRPKGAASTTLGWNSQAATAGPGTEYTVISGNLSDLQTDAGFASACALGSALSSPALADSRPDPPPHEGHYYLVRAGNACAAGTYGDGSEMADPRDLLDASSPGPCTP